MPVWRSLVVRRYAPGLATSPTRLAKQRLDERLQEGIETGGSLVCQAALLEAAEIRQDALAETSRRSALPPPTAQAAS